MRETELIVVGRSNAAESLAAEAREAGLSEILMVEDTAEIQMVDGGRPLVRVEAEEMTARAVALVDPAPGATGPPPLAVPEAVAERVYVGALPPTSWDADILVVGGSEGAAELALELAGQGTRAVLARGNASPDDLSRTTRAELLRREAERRLTVLWRSKPVAIEEAGGEPLVGFDTGGTPDLVFDHVVFADPQPESDPATQTGPVWRVGDGVLAPGRAWETIRQGSFPELPAPSPPPTRATIAELRDRHYNATITFFERTHSDLWRVRVRPDHGDVAHQAGQYASLGIGYWEPRSDAVRDPGLDRKWENLVRRSYSISSPIFEESGYLFDPAHHDDLEFYIVLVPPSPDRVPGLTPRLALKRPGDRLYVGPRVVGRYTLAPVTNPSATVVFLATGTGEAPHNAMTVELLRKGHTGPIVSVVSVRYRDDLAYLDAHHRLESRFPNYHYLPLVTRDPNTDKLYVQDALRRNMLAERFGVDLDPETTHVYLCGNPAMIGLPTWDEDTPVFPEPVGACQILIERGFQLDRARHPGNVHTEKYW